MLIKNESATQTTDSASVNDHHLRPTDRFQSSSSSTSSSVPTSAASSSSSSPTPQMRQTLPPLSNHLDHNASRVEHSKRAGAVTPLGAANRLFESVSQQFKRSTDKRQKDEGDNNTQQDDVGNATIDTGAPTSSPAAPGKSNGSIVDNTTNTSNNRRSHPCSNVAAAAANCCSTQHQHQLRSDAGNTTGVVTIIHFNDCYNIEPGPKSSGAAGFLTAVNQYRHLNPMILFSGDILSPSFMSTFTKGEQMIPVLNDIGVHCAVFGNHEFDYGVDNLIEFTKRTTFPWLLSNVIDKETSTQLGDGLVYHILEREGIKFGLIGLIEEEWLSTLSTLELDDVIYTDFVHRGRELARWLKGPENRVDFVIALTHSRTPNDIKLADSAPEIDLILGGHDHDYEIIERSNCHIVKSGTDFREFSLITLKLNTQYLTRRRMIEMMIDGGSTGVAVTTAASENYSGVKSNELLRLRVAGVDIDVDAGVDVDVDSGVEYKASSELKPFVKMDIERVDCASYPPEQNLKLKLDKFVTTIDEKMGQVLGQFNCELDGRFSSIRKYETNLGNFVTDIMLASTHADLAILNSGTLRSDRIHPKGDFRMRDLFNILGYIDPIAVLKASGYHIWKALENGVSQWPKLEGRFPQISGCSFVFDPTKLPLHRIDPKDIMIGEEPLVLDKHYKLTTKAYLASGKDGYDVLKDCVTLVPGDESPDLTTSILNHFEAINIIKSNRRTHHRQSIICLSRSSIKKILNQTSDHGSVENNSGTILNNAEHSSTLNNDDNNNNNRTINEAQEDVDEQQQQQLHDDDDKLHDKRDSELSARPGPVTSSPLLGSQLPPTPTLGNMRSIDGASDSSLANSSPATIQKQQRQPRTKRLMSLYEMEHEQCKLEPKVEGRIKIVGVNY